MVLAVMMKMLMMTMTCQVDAPPCGTTPWLNLLVPNLEREGKDEGTARLAARCTMCSQFGCFRLEAPVQGGLEILALCWTSHLQLLHLLRYAYCKIHSCPWTGLSVTAGLR